MHLVYSMYYMLACGYDREWMRIVLISVVVNFVTLIPGLLYLPGSIAVALAGLMGEGSSAVLFWSFYFRRARQMKKTRPLPAPVN